MSDTRAENLFVTEFLDDYRAECEEHLAVIRRDLLALERTGTQPGVGRQALLDELLRSFHTIKGLSSMVGVPDAVQLSHQMESYLRALRKEQVAFTSGGMDVLIAGVKGLEEVIAAHCEKRPLPDITAVLPRLAELLPAASSQAALSRLGPSGASPAPSSLKPDEAVRLAAALEKGARLWQFEFRPATALAERGINVNGIRARLQEIGELIRAAPRIAAQGGVAFEFLVASQADSAAFEAWRDDGLTWARCTPPESADPPLAPEGASIRPAAGPIALAHEEGPQPSVPAFPRSQATANVVRVDLARLDDLMRMVGDLVISRARLDDNLRRLESRIPPSEWRNLQETNLTLERQLRNLREGVMRARLVPIGEAFARMQFVVRDLAREYRKPATLTLSGQATQIDKFVVERMLDPLLHLVRNAVSHGLETPQERAQAGKPAEGRLNLRAFTAGENVVIELEDDGRGVDAVRVAERARASGLIDGQEALDPGLLLDILCTPGFSTREHADLTSGRGVGMSVVKTTVQELGGMLTLDTQVGRGSRFTIELPLTLAIADAFIVLVDTQTFAVPQTVVREVMQFQPADVVALENNEIVPYRGGVLPLVRLARLFHLVDRPNRALHALVLGSGLSAVGVVVDRVLGQREIVVRALTDPLVQIPGVAGATELGDGKAVLILDTGALTRAARRPGRVELEQAGARPVAPLS